MSDISIHIRDMVDLHNSNDPNDSQSQWLRDAFDTILSGSNLSFVSIDLSIYYRERKFVNNCINWLLNRRFLFMKHYIVLFTFYIIRI